VVIDVTGKCNEFFCNKSPRRLRNSPIVAVKTAKLSVSIPLDENEFQEGVALRSIMRESYSFSSRVTEERPLLVYDLVDASRSCTFSQDFLTSINNSAI